MVTPQNNHPVVIALAASSGIPKPPNLKIQLMKMSLPKLLIGKAPNWLNLSCLDIYNEFFFMECQRVE